MSQVSKYLASIGKKGGEAGTGKAKRRSPEQYREMAKKSAQVRKQRATDSAAAEHGPEWTKKRRQQGIIDRSNEIERQLTHIEKRSKK